MPSNRKAIPKAIQEKVLKEFSHRCAICSADRPQLHHIDGDTSNNEPMNLIPLCPNCHLIDQHGPIKGTESDKLRLFRKYKDSTILKPQFHPLYLRLKYLMTLEDTKDRDSLSENVSELVDFVKELKMGDFYSKKIHSLMEEPAIGLVTIIGDSESEQRRFQAIREHKEEYWQQLISVRERVYEIVVELLKFQPW